MRVFFFFTKKFLKLNQIIPNGEKLGPLGGKYKLLLEIQNLPIDSLNFALGRSLITNGIVDYWVENQITSISFA